MPEPMSEASTADLRARLDEITPEWSRLVGDPDEAELFELADALRAVLDVNQEHRDLLTGRGKYPQRAEECHCLGCESVRAIADALGVQRATPAAETSTHAHSSAWCEHGEPWACQRCLDQQRGERAERGNNTEGDR